jgi:hypothetical protein
MKLVSITKSKAKGKKWAAEFSYTGDKKKTIHFGATGYLDYTIGASDEQRKNYLSRHASGKTAKADTADALSYHILWGESKKMSNNIKSFKNKYSV